MDSQHNGLEERLDRAGHAWGATALAPAPAFLIAVRRRRTVRRARAAGLVVVAILAVGGVVWLGRGMSGPARSVPRPVIAENSGSPRDDAARPRPRAASPTVAQLARLNRDGSLEDPVLPETPGWHGAERAMHVLDSRKASAFDAALSGV